MPHFRGIVTLIGPAAPVAPSSAIRGQGRRALPPA